MQEIAISRNDFEDHRDWNCSRIPTSGFGQWTNPTAWLTASIGVAGSGQELWLSPISTWGVFLLRMQHCWPAPTLKTLSNRQVKAW